MKAEPFIALYAVAAAAGALASCDFSNFSNCSLLSHLSAAGEAVQTRPAVACKKRNQYGLQTSLQTHRFKKEASIRLGEHLQKHHARETGKAHAAHRTPVK